MHCSGRRSPKRRQWHARTASHSLEGQEGRARGPQRPHPQHRRLALQRGHEGDARGQIVVRGVRAALAIALEDQAREQAHGVRKAQRARVHGRAARVGAGRQAACRRSRRQVAPVHFSLVSPGCAAGAGRQAACRRSRSQVAPVHFPSFSPGCAAAAGEQAACRRGRRWLAPVSRLSFTSKCSCLGS